jgi:hypothetical protein
LLIARVVLGILRVHLQSSPSEYRVLRLLISVSTRRMEKTDFEVKEEEDGVEMRRQSFLEH